MNKSIKSLVSLCAIYFLASGFAFADAAIVIGLNDCRLLDGNGNLSPVSGSGITVSAQSANGIVKHTCSAKVEAPSNGRSAIFSYDNTDIKCGIDGTKFETEDWHIVVSASGRAKAVCSYKK